MLQFSWLKHLLCLCWTFVFVLDFLGWCVGRNPPSVVCGIRLIGLPAPSGRFFIGDCLPFPLAGRPFHRFQTGTLDITNVSSPSPGGRFVSAPLPRLSPCPMTDCNSTRGRSFLRPIILGPKATHQLASPKCCMVTVSNKNF
jgi:hypothetical protein